MGSINPPYAAGGPLWPVANKLPCHWAGMTAAAPYEQYEGFGDDPFIVPVDPRDVPVAFSAWAYAKERCEVLASAKPPLALDGCEDVTAQYAGTVISIVGMKCKHPLKAACRLVSAQTA
jgi:hypothetical protein